MPGKTTYKQITYPETTEAPDICARWKETAESIDLLPEGHETALQAGVVESTDWSMELEVNSSTGHLSSKAATGGIAWLPHPVTERELIESRTTSAKLEGLVPSTLPTTGKYMTIGLELAPTSQGKAATVSLKSGSEYSTQLEAEEHSPAVTSGKLRVRDVVVKNTSAVYSIVKQTDRRAWAREVAIGTPGTVRQETGTTQSFLSWGIVQSEKIIIGTGDFTIESSAEGSPPSPNLTVKWTKEKPTANYFAIAFTVGTEHELVKNTTVTAAHLFIPKPLPAATIMFIAVASG